jgi:hypothetical protein
MIAYAYPCASYNWNLFLLVIIHHKRYNMAKHAYDSLISLCPHLKEFVQVKRNMLVDLGQCDTVEDDLCSHSL